ncbi:alpha/beta-hydrolase [Metschnikowia bicuspidata var. bicuspidata NRRL YB-4993]|uniref:Kynurenine formamidase n=1 Tax=Metschnikowia bicuspidata var. bicuspidata NRRL YB-4993 TaxID=869754 RepID=A0A1A0H8R0_9ASCO|nr:alpha/beta-hydrolase [Metschnikowia bicuspidata var. bicuspidata NRRL YB-4993]OBA20385.1 alpha/beta-hydrolase [Metschnikowia bicuspidata var. bicuspidata NRRL YB-4993]
MEISYGPHALQKLKVFHHSPLNNHTLLLVHGGAWNDPLNTYDDFQDLVGFLQAAGAGGLVNIVGINYRLTPEVCHPQHLHDVLGGISKLVHELGVRRLLVAGHSVGATLALQLLNYRQIMADGVRELQKAGRAVEPVAPVAEFTLDTLFFIDGIYDIAGLVSEYGAPYAAFVDRAFVSERQYRGAVQPSWRSPGAFELCFEKAVVVQSTQDELLSLRQTKGFLAFLRGVGVDCEYHQEAWGRHEEVYRRRELAAVMVAALTRGGGNATNHVRPMGGEGGEEERGREGG